MKLLILPLFVAFFMVGSINSASAHCAICEASEKKTEKPCAKKKCCGCGKHAKKEMSEEKPCKVCDKSERKWKAKKKRSEIFFNE